MAEKKLRLLADQAMGMEQVGEQMADLVLEISLTFVDELNEDFLNGAFRLCHYSALLMNTLHPEHAFSRLLQKFLGWGKLSDSRAGAFFDAVHKRRALRALLALQSRSPEQEGEILQLELDLKDPEDADELSPATTFTESANSPAHPLLLYQCLNENAVVIEATFGPRGFLAFAVTREGIQQVHYGSTSTVDMCRPVMQIMQIMKEKAFYLCCGAHA
ncbi:hypothetical protein PENANT_c007G01989 [Penicillium antarcticum]|uniref:Uncharacterized protein n=1 Tax=Penicillium antarcticum TaxID=416450 RepID=A0A1V6QBK8_9EURO|nr:hypothetical protein PENANT_c007G01989 [Penicillium antarcticum]